MTHSVKIAAHRNFRLRGKIAITMSYHRECDAKSGFFQQQSFLWCCVITHNVTSHRLRVGLASERQGVEDGLHRNVERGALLVEVRDVDSGPGSEKEDVEKVHGGRKILKHDTVWTLNVKLHREDGWS